MIMSANCTVAVLVHTLMHAVSFDLLLSPRIGAVCKGPHFSSDSISIAVTQKEEELSSSEPIDTFVMVSRAGMLPWAVALCLAVACCVSAALPNRVLILTRPSETPSWCMTKHLNILTCQRLHAVHTQHLTRFSATLTATPATHPGAPTD